MKPSQLAALIGVPPSTITRILRRERHPGFEIMARIHKATGGAVTPNDFLDKEPEQRTPRSELAAE